MMKIDPEDCDTAGTTPTPVQHWFEFQHENLNLTPETDRDVASFYKRGMITGNGMWPHLSAATQNWLKNNSYGLLLNMTGSSEVLQRKAAESTRWQPGTVEDIENEKAKIQSLTTYFTNILGKPNSIMWDVMPEWDQSGGYWAYWTRPTSTTPRTQAYTDWKNFFWGLTPLGTYFSQNRQQRGFNMVSVSDYPCNAFYAFEWGIDIGLLERDIDELGDIATGIAFLRGAARQYNKSWGIDISEWKTSGNTATNYNDNNQRIGGWSESYHRRHLYISYMSGANIIHLEPCLLFNETTGAINPFGQLCLDFADFALTRHTDVGLPYVSTALMLDFYDGFDTKHGLYNQGNKVWYQTIPYLDGDHMTNNMLNLIYPEHNLSGTCNGALWQHGNDTDYTNRLLVGLDTAPFEPMGKSTWGDNFDVILNNASSSCLDNYKTVILAGNVVIDSKLRSKLYTWVCSGGTLIANVKQVTSDDSSLTGVTLTTTERTSSGSKWLVDGTIYSEPSYNYYLVTLNTATAVADNNSNGEPIITKNVVGSGKVYLTTPYYMQDTNKSQILNIGKRLIDTEVNLYAPATLEGNTVEYIVNTGIKKTVVTVVNNNDNDWSGYVVMPKPTTSYTAQEWITDTTASTSEASGNVKISASVPAYDVKVYTLTFL